MNQLSPKDLVQALVDAGMSQTVIARITKTSQPTIGRILSGDHKDPRSSTVDALRALYQQVMAPKAA